MHPRFPRRLGHVMQHLPRSGLLKRLLSLLLLGLVGPHLCPPTHAQGQLRQVVEMDMQIRGLNYQGGLDDVTGFISVVAAGGGSHHSVWLTSTNSWVQVGDLPSTTARFEVNRAYSFECQGAWVYGPLTHVDFRIPCGPFGYTLTIVDTSGQAPDRVLNEQDSTWAIPAVTAPPSPVRSRSRSTRLSASVLPAPVMAPRENRSRRS
jgi:hypothetical protein